MSGFLLVRVVHLLLVYLGQVGESIHDESSEKHRVRHLIVLDRERIEALERFQLRNLNEAINIVVLE